MTVKERRARAGGMLGALACLTLGSAAGADPSAPESGAYEVEVRLELPHLDDMTARKTARLCLTAEAGANNHGLAVLSDNNPLAKCPVANVRREGETLAFDIVCAGRNAAKARAAYMFAPEHFRARISMNMGGKNMTMTEIQAGRRIGACEAAKTPAP